MRELDYGKGYKYAHDFEDAYTPQEYLPESLGGQSFYKPAARGFEKIIKERMAYWQKIRNSAKNGSKMEAPKDP